MRTRSLQRGPRGVAFILLLFVTSCSGDGKSGSASTPGATGGWNTTGGSISTSPGQAGGAPASGGAQAAGGSVVGLGGSAGAVVVGSGGMLPVNTGGQFPVSGAGGAGNAGAAGMAGAAGAGGASGAGGGGGAGGAASYSPCPAGGMPCKILPLGDSITYGLGTSDQSAYRVELFRKAVAAGKHITFVGSLMAGPSTVDGMPFPRNNEGHSGWTIDQVAGIVPTPALGDDPDIILLMIGTNDMYMGSPGTAPQRLAALLDKIIAASARPLVVVAQITPLGSGSTAVQTYNAALPAIVDARAAAGKHVKLVDMFTGFSTTMLADGVHPNADGNKFMAAVWYPAIEGVLH